MCVCGSPQEVGAPTLGPLLSSAALACNCKSERLPPPYWHLLQELREAADAEAAALKASLSEAVARDEIVAGRIKAEFWDSMEVSGDC